MYQTLYGTGAHNFTVYIILQIYIILRNFFSVPPPQNAHFCFQQKGFSKFLGGETSRGGDAKSNFWGYLGGGGTQHCLATL